MSHIPSTDTRDVVTERALPQWLISRVPAILEQYHEKSRQQYGPHATDDDVSAYFLLSFVLKPHLELLMEAGDETELQRIFDLLEYLANHGDPSVQNELRVTMEEVDLWKVWKYLGSRMRQNEFESLTWFPERKERQTPANQHVNKTRYQQRWREEIDRIGGCDMLVQEFGISGMRAPEPGGKEWLGMKLPWPYPEKEV